MKLDSVKVFLVANPPPGFGGRYFVFLKLKTACGIEGVGEVYAATFGPKVVGKMYSEKLAKLHFWLFVIGFHLTFDVMHVPGLLGMPRRIYTFEAGRGWDTLNLIVSIGVVIQAAGILCFLVNVIRSLRKGQPAGSDPWNAWTLEWATTSPPPEYNFDELPVVRSRRPLWDLKHPTDPDWKYE
jgi:cytochrome c oxidase subunit 1